MYSVLRPVGISCQIEDVLWKIESSSPMTESQLTLAGKAINASFLRDFGSPVDIDIHLSVRDPGQKAKQLSNESGQWYEIGSTRASPIEKGDIELLQFAVSFDQRGFDSCVLMALSHWRRETHDLMAVAEIFGIEQYYGGPRERDRWPSDKQLLPLTSFGLFIRPKSWRSNLKIETGSG